MLKAPSQTTVLQSSNSDDSSAPIDLAKPMHLIFDTHYVPPGFYVRLLATVVRNPHCQVLFQQINRFTVTVAYQEVDEITLREHPESIEIQVSRAAQGGSHAPPFYHVCQDILTMIQASIIEVHEWLPGVSVSTAFVCSACSNRSYNRMHYVLYYLWHNHPEVPRHFVKFDRDTLSTTTVRCQNEKLQVLGQCQSQQYWLKLQEKTSPHSGAHSAREKRDKTAFPEATTTENYPGDTTQGTTKMPIASSRSTVPKLADVIEHVTTPRWFDLGLALGVDDSTLRFIGHDTRGDSRTGLRRMFQEWLSSCEQPSWDNVISALRRIGENRLAAEIRHKLKF